MAEQLFRDPDIEVTPATIAEALGNVNNSYVKFIEELYIHDVNVEWRYYNDGKAWLGKGQYKWIGVRGGQKEITAFWLSIWDGYFKVTIYIPEKSRAEALRLPLNGDIVRMIENSTQMGKLKFFPLIFDLSSDELFGDVYTLIEFRKAIK